MEDDTGQIVTVTGPIDPESLGVTLTHEHLFIDVVDALFTEPTSAVDRQIAREPVTLENLSYVRRNTMQHRDNMRLDSVEEAIEGVNRYLQSGGKTIVDVTPKNAGEDPVRVQAIARKTGATIIHGTAHYIKSVLPDRINHMAINDIKDEFVKDIQEGINGTNVRSGLIGELGLSAQIHPEEKKVLKAAARAALQTGASISIHPPGRTKHSQKNRTYPSSRWCLDILDIIESEGLSPGRVVMGHMDRTVFEDITYQKELANRGAFIEYDLWGMETTLDQYGDAYMSDYQRVGFVEELIDDGYSDHLLFSQDIYTKLQRRKYGGFGYSHILDNIVPLLIEQGIDQQELEKIMIDNPARMLTFEEPI